MKTTLSRAFTKLSKNCGLERLEERRLMSAVHGVINTIPFSSAPTAVQGGLDALAATDGLTAPDSTQTPGESTLLMTVPSITQPFDRRLEWDSPADPILTGGRSFERVWMTQLGS